MKIVKRDSKGRIVEVAHVPLPQFCKNGHDTFVCGRTNHGQCVLCRKEYMKQYHKTWVRIHPHKKATKEKQKLNNEKSRKKLMKFKNKLKDVPCIDCGIKYPPYVMTFDHRPGTKKLFDISKPSTIKLSKLKEEIAKCDIVCANCHAIRTHNRLVEKKNKL